jgi:hypothetical protein
MKNMRLNLLLSLALIWATCLTGCKSNDCKCNHNYDCIELSTKYFTVEKNDWVWNNYFGRFEYSFDNVSVITKKVYEKGLVHVGVFITEGVEGESYEVLKPLPFVQTYAEHFENGEIIYYTETISYDIMPNSILFSIQASDLYDGDEYLQAYEFKVSIIQ